jgi:hypothetical protein
MVRIVLAAILGGILMFAWGALSHTLLPFAHDALQPLPDEPAVRSALAAGVPQAGTYYFPWLDEANADAAARTAWEREVANGPSGLLVYRPAGGEVMSPRQLVQEFASNVLAALLGALLLVQLPGGYVRRVAAALGIGVAAWLSISVSQWTWYGFGTGFLLGDLVDQAGGWLLAGLGMAALLKPRRRRSSFS